MSRGGHIALESATLGGWRGECAGVVSFVRGKSIIKGGRSGVLFILSRSIGSCTVLLSVATTSSIGVASLPSASAALLLGAALFLSRRSALYTVELVSEEDRLEGACDGVILCIPWVLKKESAFLSRQRFDSEGKRPWNLVAMPCTGESADLRFFDGRCERLSASSPKKPLARSMLASLCIESDRT